MGDWYRSLSERERFVVSLLLMSSKHGYAITLTLYTIREYTCFTARELREVVSSLVEKKVVSRDITPSMIRRNRGKKKGVFFGWVRLNSITLNPDLEI